MSEDLIGKKLGPYEIRMLLGKGGMSSVYLAYQSSMDRVVALKLLPREFLHDSTFLARFQNEARLVAKLEHINILPVYDVGEDNGIPYIVMRYLSGGTVADLLADHLPDNETIARILEQVASALDYAHMRGIIHRDIKPSNVLLDSSGNAYLADFGIARMVAEASGLTGSRVIGTPSYVSPEQVKKGMVITPSVDIYAMGVLAYEMLAGEPPYRDDDPTKTLMAHVMEPVPSIQDVDPNVNSEIDRVVQKALAKRAEDRYPSAGAFAAAFAAAVSGGSASRLGEATDPRSAPSFAPINPPMQPPARPPAPIVPNPPGNRPDTGSLPNQPYGQMPPPKQQTPYPPPRDAYYDYGDLKSMRQERGRSFPIWLIAPIVVIALLGGLIFVAFALTDGDPSTLLAILTPQVGNQPTATATVTITPGGPATDAPTPRPGVLPAPSGGYRLAYASNSSNNYDIYIVDIDGSNRTKLTENGGPDFDPAWSPDGNEIIYTSREELNANSDLWVMDADGSDKQQITDSEDFNEVDPDWSPDGQWIAFASDRDGDFDIYVMRPDGSELRQVINEPNDQWTPRWSSDGVLIVYTDGNYNQSSTTDLYMVDANGGTPLPVAVTASEPDTYPDFAFDSLRIVFTSGMGLAGNNTALFTLHLPTQTQEQLTSGEGQDDDPVWSPDSVYIAFDARRGGASVFDLYIINVATREETRLTEDAGDNVAPAWQP